MGATAASFTRRVRGMDGVDEKTYTKLIRNLRATLVAERAYDDALAGDPDPIGGFLDEAFWSGMATGVARAFPSGLIPAPSTATAAEKWAIKDGCHPDAARGSAQAGWTSPLSVDTTTGEIQALMVRW